MPTLILPLTYTVPQVLTENASRVSLPPERNFGEWIELDVPEIDVLDAPLAAEFGPAKNRQEIRHHDGRNYMRLQPFTDDMTVDDLNPTSKYVCRIWDTEILLKLKRGQIEAWSERSDMTIVRTYSKTTHQDQRRLQIADMKKSLAVIDGFLCTTCYDPMIEFSFDFLNKPKGRVVAYPSIRKPMFHGSPGKNPAPKLKIQSWPIAESEEAKEHNETWYGRNPNAGVKSMKIHMPEVFEEDYSLKRLALAALNAKEAMAHVSGGLFEGVTDSCAHQLHNQLTFHEEFISSIRQASPHGVALLEREHELKFRDLEEICQKLVDDVKTNTSINLKSFGNIEPASMEYIRFMENIALRSIIDLAATLERYQNRSLDLDFGNTEAIRL